MQTMGLRVRVIAEASAVAERLRALPADLSRGPFQQAAWIDAWLATRAERRPTIALATVTSETTDALLLVLPMMLDVRSAVPCWTALDDGVADYNAPLLAADFAPTAATIRWIWERILDQLPSGDLVFLEKLPENVAGRRNPLLDLAGPSPSCFARHPLALGAGLAAVRARYRHGRTLARKRHKLERKGTLDFVVLTGAEAVPDLVGLMGWRSRRFDTRPITTEFYGRLLAETSIARLGLLRLDGRTIAGCFAVVCGDGAVRLLVVAFDERWKNWSPGLLAIDAMIAWAIDEGYDEFDFTIGSEPYKFDFGVATEPLWEIRRSLRLRGSVVLSLLGARRIAADLARRTFPTLVAARARRIAGRIPPP
jgi:CelD/BcsL family acetyltransferase involved in cellulose biosynthesis